MRTVVLALGGNALTREGQAGTYAAAALAGTHGTRVASRKQTRVAAGA